MSSLLRKQTAFVGRLPHHGTQRRQTPPLAPRRWLSFSRMLDMGGAPSGLHDNKTKTRIHASKNCKLQAVCFDFEVLTKYTAPPSTNNSNANDNNDDTLNNNTKLVKDVAPDANMVQQVANLLNINLGGSPSTNKKTREEGDDDLSLLTGEGNEESKRQSSSSSSSKTQQQPLNNDIRAKYADKLSKRGVQGGLAQVELAKHQVQETLQRGDAAGHLAARKIAAANPVSRSWMALTGTGALLQYLTQRSIHIVLLPRPDSQDTQEHVDVQGERMEDFKRQLQHEVVLDELLKDGRPGSTALVSTALEKLKLDPNVVLLVSDRDDYLRAAKDAAMMTCRILPPNARRGNISAHFMVPGIPEVQDVVNEINGISYNAILKRR